MKDWDRRVAVGEGLRSVASGGLVTISIVLGLMLALAVPATLDASAVARIVDDETRWRAAGGDLLIATRDEGFSASQCESLNTVDGIDAAFGARRLPGTYATVAAPDAGVAVVLVTGGIHRFLGIDGGGAVVTPDARDDTGSGDVLQLLPASPVLLGSGQAPGGAGGREQDLPLAPLEIAAVTPLDVLGDEYAYSIAVPQAAAGTVERCFVRTTPATADAVRAVLPALLTPDDDGTPVVVLDRLVSGQFSRDFSTELDERTTALGPYLGGAVAGLLWLLVSWFRRAEDSLYTTLGAERTTLILLRGTEWATLLAVALLGAWSLSLAGLALTDTATRASLLVVAAA